MVERLGGLGELEVLQQFVHFGHELVGAVQDPAIRIGELGPRGQPGGHPRAVHQRELGGVEQLRAEAARPGDPFLADRRVRTRVRPARQGEPQRVGAVVVHPLQRIDGVARRLGHLLAVRIADHAVQRDHLERLDAVHRVEPEHHHPGHPEEQDVVAGDEHAGRIELPQIRGVVRPAQRGERPQARGEPGVEHVLVLAPALAGGRIFVRSDADDLAVRAVPDRDAVAPPHLPRDGPVVQVVDPVEVALRHLRRMHRDPAVTHRVACFLGQRADLDEPLQRQPRLDRLLGAGAVPDAVHVRPLLRDDAVLRAQCLAHRDTGLEPVHAVEFGAGVRDPALLVHDRRHRQVVALPDLEVVRVVRRGDLHRAAAELGVHVLVGDDRDLAAGQRQLDLGADQVPVALVVRVHRDGGVAEHRLHAGGGHDDFGVAGAVAHRHQLAVDLAVLHLDVGDRRAHRGRPVHQPLRPVDQAVVVEPLEDRLHRAGEPGVHGEPLPAPVHAVAEPRHLRQDRPAVLLLPLPNPLQEALPAEFAVVDALFPKLVLDQRLHRDAGVVHARQPQRLVALHPAAPGEQVHQGVLEGVADVQAAGDVRRRDDDRERRLLAVRIRDEVLGGYPALVQLGLYVGRVPARRKFTGLCGCAGLCHTPILRTARDGFSSPHLHRSRQIPEGRPHPGPICPRPAPLPGPGGRCRTDTRSSATTSAREKSASPRLRPMRLSREDAGPDALAGPLV